MKIYLDLLFISDCIMDYLVLKIASLLVHKKPGFFRLFLSTVIAAASSTAFVYMGIFQKGNMVRVLIILVTTLIMVKISFSPIHAREYIYLMLLIILSSVFLEGIVAGWEQWVLAKWKWGRSTGRSLIFFGGFIGLGYGFLKRFFYMTMQREKEKLISITEIQVGNQKARARALLDSGNSLREPITQKPVVIAEQSLFNSEMVSKGFFAIPYRALGNEGDYMKGILADEVRIKTRAGEDIYKKVMIGLYEGKLSAQGQYQILLHPELINH